MPIPKPPKKGWTSIEHLEEAYLKDGWKKQITFSWITMNARLGGCIETIYQVDSNKISCSCGEGGRFTFIQLRSTGIIMSCGSCKKTAGQLSFEDRGVKILSTRRLPISEAFTITDETGQYLPPSMKNLRRLNDPLRNLR